MASTTIKNRINDLIGDFVSELSSELELVCSAFNEVVDLCPNNLLWKYVDNFEDLYSGNANFPLEGYKIIAIHRKDTNGVKRIARQVSVSEGNAASDANSIYYMDAAQEKSPIFFIDGSGASLKLLPAVTGLTAGVANTAYAYYFKYFSPDDSETDTIQRVSIINMYLYNEDANKSIINHGYPKEAVQAGCLKAAINIINAKVSLAVQEEEDAELLTLLQSQAQALTASYNAELKRIQEVAE